VRVDIPVSADAPYCKWSTIFWMVLIAFAVRVSFLLLLGTYCFDRADDDGVCVINNSAAPIGKGLGFNSPFSNEHTGPTSWIAPVHPLLVALAFHYFGIMTHASIIFTLPRRDGFQRTLNSIQMVPVQILERSIGHGRSRAGDARKTLRRTIRWFT
jgi:hypothetical protein